MTEPEHGEKSVKRAKSQDSLQKDAGQEQIKQMHHQDGNPHNYPLLKTNKKRIKQTPQ